VGRRRHRSGSGLHPAWRRTLAVERRAPRSRSRRPPRWGARRAVVGRRRPRVAPVGRPDRAEPFAILPAVSVKPIITLGDPRLRLRGELVDSFGKTLHGLLDDLAASMPAA